MRFWIRIFRSRSYLRVSGLSSGKCGSRTLTILGQDDSAVSHCILFLFVSGLYWKTQVSSPVMICLRISELSLIFFSTSTQNLTQFCFWSSDKILGTLLAHTFCITRSCSKIVCTDSLFRLSSSDIICTVNLQSL